MSLLMPAVRSSTTPTTSLKGPKSSGGPQRSPCRAVCAAAVAGAVAFAVSVYPHPGASQLLQLSPFGDLAEHPQLFEDSLDRVVEPASFKREIRDLSSFAMADVLQLVGLLTDEFDQLPAGTLMEMLGTQDLSEVVDALERLTHFQSEPSLFPGLLAGGGGSSGGVPVNLIPSMVLLLEFLTRSLPPVSAQVFRDIFTSMLPTFTRSLGIDHLPPLSAAQVTTFLGAAPITLTTPAALAPHEPLVVASVDAAETPIVHTPPVTEVQVYSPVESPMTVFVPEPPPPPVEPPPPTPTPISMPETAENQYFSTDETPTPPPAEEPSESNSPGQFSQSLSEDPGENSSGGYGGSESSGANSPADSNGDPSDNSGAGGSSDDSGGGSSQGDSGGGSTSGE